MSIITRSSTVPISTSDHQERHVALIIETSNAYDRGLLRGIKTYLRGRRPWSIYLGECSRTSPDVSWLSNWTGDGIIARIENDEIASQIQRLGVPTVDVSAAQLVPDIPRVETNDESIARLAAEHLLERGFEHFGYSGDSRFVWSQNRCHFFKRYIEEAGFECDVLDVSDSSAGQRSWETARRDMSRWVQSLPKPAGIMACYDIRGQQLLEACRLAKVAVPYEVGVIGVDNDELLCEISAPPLSSIIPDTLRIGYLAALHLDRMMMGGGGSSEQLLVDPLGIQERQSTDVVASEDRILSESVRYIQEHAYDEINVNDLLKTIPLSRRAFESRFRKVFGRTPHEEIINVKLQLIKELLTETDLSLCEIAERTSFKHSEYLSVMFKRQTGMTPTDFRKRILGRP